MAWNKVWVGTSGWNYKHWSGGVFYPPGLKPVEWLRYYCRFFETVEINYSFYRLPEKTVFESWQKTAPRDFCFSVKASRFITHMKRLLDPRESLSRLLENASGLGEKCGPILFQLPPRFPFDRDRLAALLDLLEEQSVFPGVRIALEVRDPSWYNDACFELLHTHDAALVLADQPGFAAQGPLTAGFVFVRRHGPGGVFGASYPEDTLAWDADRIRGWQAEGREVFIYFNNDPGGNAVRNARRLKELLGMPVGPSQLSGF
jgi:uncharacterized protein YecE (DUF72 family)